MIEPTAFLLFLGGALLLNVTPGPDMAFTLASTVKNGACAGIAAAIGVGFGSLAWAVFAAIGLAALVASSQQALAIIRIAGGLYLIYLAIDAYRHRNDPMDAHGAGGVGGAFQSGFVTNLLNPKVGIFFLAFLPAFLDPAAGPIWLQSIVLGAVFSVSGAAVLVLVALAAGRIRARISQSPAWLRRMRLASAAVYGGLGIGLIFSRQH